MTVQTAAAIAALGLTLCGGAPPVAGHMRAPGEARPANLPAMLDVYVNEVPHGPVLARVSQGDAWLPVRWFEDVGLLRLVSAHEPVDGVPHVRLGALAPELTYRLDEEQFTLRLHVRPSALSATSRDLSVGAPRSLEHVRSTSMFVNYGVAWHGDRDYAVATEAGASVRGALITSTWSRTGAALRRGSTSLTWDDRARRVRWRAGDLYLPAGVLTGGFAVGGLAVSREFSLDPYRATHPTAAVSGVAETPSTAEVYVNEQLVSREALPPGEFHLSNLPTPAGRGTTRVVVHDAFGNTRQIVAPFFVATELLAPGLHAFRLQAGWRRSRRTDGRWSYSAPAAAGMHRVGLTRWLTAGVEAEGSDGNLALAPTLASRLPLGTLELAAAFSARRGSRRGQAWHATYALSGARVSAHLFARALSPTFVPLAQHGLPDPARLEAGGMVGVSLGRRISLSMRHGLTHRAASGRERPTGISGSLKVRQNLNVIVSAARTRRALDTPYEVQVSAVLSLGPRTFGNVTAARTPGGVVSSVDMQRSLPRGEGAGYRVRLRDGVHARASTAGLLQTPWGRYEAAIGQAGNRLTVAVEGAGALAIIGGGVHPTRPLTDSYALVRVPDVAGVRVLASHQEIGRTNRKGDLLVPDLLSNYGNVVGIVGDDVPFDRSIAATSRTVAPPHRGGALIAFSARPLRALAGRVVIRGAGGDRAPAFGQLVVDAGGDAPVESPLGAAGQFFLERVPEGSRPAVIEHLGERCAFTLHVPPLTTSVVNVGVLVCEASAGGGPTE